MYVRHASVKIAMRKHILGGFFCALCIAFDPGMHAGLCSNQESCVTFAI